MSVGDIILEALTAGDQAKKEGGKVIVCICGTFAVPANSTACPVCSKEVKNA